MHKHFLILSFASFIFSQPVLANKARLLLNDQHAIQSRVDIIQQAKSEILVEYFSVWNDDPAVGGMALLVAAAQRGITVKIVIDSLANGIPEPLLLALEQMGTHKSGTKNIQIRLYNPPTLNPGKWTHRDHSKMLIVDGKTFITGGRNVGDKYFGVDKRRNFRDLDVIAEGKVAQDARENFLKVWRSKLVKSPLINSHFINKLDPALCIYSANETACLHDVKVAQASVDKERTRLVVALKEILKQEHDDLVKPFSGKDWLELEPELAKVEFLSHKPDELVNAKNAYLSHVLLKELKKATKEVNLVSPYLIPTPLVMNALGELVKRGVKVRFVTNSIGSTDNLLAQAGYRFKKQQLVNLGIEIHEYRGPDTLHAKAAIIDSRKVIICTCNLDPRSANLNREVGLLITDVPDGQFVQNLEFIIEHFRLSSVLVAKDGQELNLEAQKKSASLQKRRIVDAMMLTMPLLINQL